MFDIGFAELLLIAVVGLLVVGPERLPEAIRTASKWFARLKRGINKIKADVERELGADELRAQLRSDSITDSFKRDKEQLEALDTQAQSSHIQLLDSLASLEDKPPPREDHTAL